MDMMTRVRGENEKSQGQEDPGRFHSVRVQRSLGIAGASGIGRSADRAMNSLMSPNEHGILRLNNSHSYNNARLEETSVDEKHRERESPIVRGSYVNEGGMQIPE